MWTIHCFLSSGVLEIESDTVSGLPELTPSRREPPASTKDLPGSVLNKCQSQSPEELGAGGAKCCQRHLRFHREGEIWTCFEKEWKIESISIKHLKY